MKGVITAIIRAKGFGFIQDEHGQERFFHARNLRGVLWPEVLEGTKVEFVPVTAASGDKGNGLRAEAVVAVA